MLRNLGSAKKMKYNTVHSLSFVWRNIKKRDEISR